LTREVVQHDARNAHALFAETVPAELESGWQEPVSNCESRPSSLHSIVYGGSLLSIIEAISETSCKMQGQSCGWKHHSEHFENNVE
jgi:hypothetical protein